jgi:hypothetical protein
MRETRSTGSVEGVMSNRESYSDPCGLHPEAAAEGSIWERPPAAGERFSLPWPGKRNVRSWKGI